MPHRPDWSRTRLPLDEPTLLASVQLIRVCHHMALCGRILGPWDHYIGEQHDGIRNQMGDLYSPWVGTRELLLRRRNP
jgi:hypothetical protein